MSKESRMAKRKNERSIKIDMSDWLVEKGGKVTELEVLAWKAGYLAGMNRAFNLILSKDKTNE
mgnify:CR=1 FL=1